MARLKTCKLVIALFCMLPLATLLLSRSSIVKTKVFAIAPDSQPSSQAITYISSEKQGSNDSYTTCSTTTEIMHQIRTKRVTKLRNNSKTKSTTLNFDYVNDFDLMQSRTATETTARNETELDLNFVTEKNHQCKSQRDFLHWKHYVQKRVLKLRKQCDSTGAYIHPAEPTSDRTLMNNMLVDTKHKTIFCSVAKVASKSWRRVFLTMLGVAHTPEAIEPRDVYSTHGRKLDKLSNYDSNTVKNMLRSYRKILFVRDPFERLVSAYLDKFTRDYESCNRLFGDDIRKFRRNGTNPEPRPGFNDTVLFDEFVRYVMSFDVSSRKTNDHWATYMELCRPCLINYTVVGKMEAQQTDLPCTMRLMLDEQEQANYTFPSEVKEASQSRVAQHFGLLTDEEVFSLWRHFEFDFRLFGYKPQHFGREKLVQLFKLPNIMNDENETDEKDLHF